MAILSAGIFKNSWSIRSFLTMSDKSVAREKLPVDRFFCKTNNLLSK